MVLSGINMLVAISICTFEFKTILLRHDIIQHFKAQERRKWKMFCWVPSKPTLHNVQPQADWKTTPDKLRVAEQFRV